MRNKLFMFIFSAFLLAGCSSANTNSNDTVNAEGYPIKIQHAFGETIITEKPQRVAAIAWGNQDTALALGVAPVGVSKSNFGALGEHGLALWTEDEFANLGIDTPVVFDDTDGLDFEAIADTNPDVILASYSGITQEDYATLSKIAPVVAYPKNPWQTYWREQTLLNATGLGLKKEGEELVKQTEELIASKLAEHPELKGKTGAFLWLDPMDTSSFYAYLPSDPRANYLTDLGLAFPDSIQTLANGSQDFSITVSSEHADQLNDVDIIVTYGDDHTLAALQSDSLLSKIPAIKNGAVVIIDNKSALAASATPTILGIPYTIDEYLRLLSEAANKVA